MYIYRKIDCFPLSLFCFTSVIFVEVIILWKLFVLFYNEENILDPFFHGSVWMGGSDLANKNIEWNWTDGSASIIL